MLARKTPNLTPHLDQPEVGTGQLKLYPSSTNPLETSPNLAPPEVLASGRQGFAMSGHDAKVIKIEVIFTAGSLSQGKANSSQDRKQNLRLLPRCII